MASNNTFSSPVAPVLCEFLRERSWVINDFRRLEGRPAEFTTVDGLPLGSSAYRYLTRRFPGGLYRHQREGIERLLAGKDVCLATGTASGKSAVFYAAVLHELASRPTSRVLGVFPLKALAREQEERMREATRSAEFHFSVERIDGQVPTTDRVRKVQNARLLVVTPDIVHAWLLPSVSEGSVRDFVRNLALVIVDEVHSYTGVFGSNAAFLFRRLDHLNQVLGGRFRYLCASATLADPQRHLSSLFGREFDVVGDEYDSSPRQPSDIIFATPPPATDLLSALKDLFLFLTQSPSRCFLAFVDSRKQVEYLGAMVRRSQDRVSDDDFYARPDIGNHLENSDILPFRAGYELQDREKILDRLAQGRIKGIISTSALELGIDIAYVDTGVLVGVPPSQTSLLQRIGRIGRHSPGLVVLVNRGDLRDERIFNNPDLLFTLPPGPSSLYLENPRIQYLHALCLARHGGEHDMALQTSSGDALDFESPCSWPAGFLELCRNERVGEVPQDLQPMKMEGGDDPNHVFPLRDVESQFRVILKQGPEEAGRGELSYSQVMREAYPGAVYYYAGQPCRVYKVSPRDKIILVRRESHYSTRPNCLPTLVFPNLSSGNVHLAARHGSLVVLDCNLQIRETVVGFKERRGPNEFSVQYPLSFPETGLRFDLPRFVRNYFTTGVILTAPYLTEEAGVADTCTALLYQAFLALIPFEPQDIGWAVDRHRIDRGPIRRGALFLALYDTTYGSLRLSSKITEDDWLPRITSHALELASTMQLEVKDPPAYRVLSQLAEEAKLPREALFLEPEAIASSSDSQKVRVLLPGSRGLHQRLNNEEFIVEAVFYSPKIQGLAYRGRCQTDTEDGTHVAAIDWIVPVPGECRFGWYDPETGELTGE